MPSTLAELEQKASQLSQRERAELALAMLRSLEPADPGDIEEVWRIEAEARWTAIERGEAQTIPASEVFAEVRRALR